MNNTERYCCELPRSLLDADTRERFSQLSFMPAYSTSSTGERSETITVSGPCYEMGFFLRPYATLFPDRQIDILDVGDVNNIRVRVSRSLGPNDQFSGQLLPKLGRHVHAEVSFASTATTSGNFTVN